MLLPHANVLLDSAVARASSPTREASQGLLGTCRAPPHHHVDGRVSLSVLGLVDGGILNESCTVIRFSYFMNMTYIGQAIFMSMDIPDAFLAVGHLFRLARMHVDAYTSSSRNY